MHFNARAEVILAMREGRWEPVLADTAEHTGHRLRPRADCYLCREAVESAQRLRAECAPRSVYGN